MPSSHLILCRPLLLLSLIPPRTRVFSNESTLCMRWPKYWSSATTSVLQNGLVGSPCSPRDSQESSPTTQFKSINSLALSFLYSPILTSIYDYWKNHSFDWVDLCRKVICLLFNMLSRLVITFLPRSKHPLISCCSHHLQ